MDLKGNSGFYLPPNLAELIGVVTLPPLLTMVAMFKDNLDVGGETIAKTVMDACAQMGVETFSLDVKQMAEACYSKMMASGSKPAAAVLPSIVELAALFRREIGVDGRTTKQVIAHACARLGIEIDGLNVKQQASRCFAVLQQRSPEATSKLAKLLGAKQRETHAAGPEDGHGFSELNFSGWPVVGPPLHETMELLVPFGKELRPVRHHVSSLSHRCFPITGPYLRTLNLNGCSLGGNMPTDEIWSKFEKLHQVDLNGTGFGTGVPSAKVLCSGLICFISSCFIAFVSKPYNLDELCGEL